MLKIGYLCRKIVVGALVVALSFAALPAMSVSAAGSGDPPQPPVEETQVTNERIEHAWERIQEAYERQGDRIERAGEISVRIQSVIEKMNQNGKDTSALQAALDAFEQALAEAQPLYESAGKIVSTHAGFDAQGKVTDREQAVETVKELGKAMKEIRQLVGEPGKALREAIRAYRDANRVDTDV